MLISRRTLSTVIGLIAKSLSKSYLMIIGSQQTRRFTDPLGQKVIPLPQQTETAGLKKDVLKEDT
jgi:hypothetical protein